MDPENKEIIYFTDETGRLLEAAPLVKRMQTEISQKADELGLQGDSRKAFIEAGSYLISAFENGDVKRNIYRNLDIFGEFGEKLNNAYKNKDEIKEKNPDVGRGADVYDRKYLKSNWGTSKGTAAYRNKVNTIGELTKWVNLLIDEELQTPEPEKEKSKTLSEILEDDFVKSALGGMLLWQTWKNNNTSDQKFESLETWLNKVDRAALAKESGMPLADVVTKLGQLLADILRKDMHAATNSALALGIDLPKYFTEKRSAKKKDPDESEPTTLDIYTEKAKEELGPGLSEEAYTEYARLLMEDAVASALTILDTRHKLRLKAAWEKNNESIEDSPLNFDTVSSNVDDDLNAMRSKLNLPENTQLNTFWLRAATTLDKLMENSLGGILAKKGQIDLWDLTSFFVKCYSSEKIKFPNVRFDTKKAIYEDITSGPYSGYVILKPTADNGKYCIIFDPSNNDILRVPIYKLEGTKLHAEVFKKFKDDYEKIHSPKIASIHKLGGSLIPKFLPGGELNWREALSLNALNDESSEDINTLDSLKSNALDTVDLNAVCTNPRDNIPNITLHIDETFNKSDVEDLEEPHLQHFVYDFETDEWDFNKADYARIAGIIADATSLGASLFPGGQVAAGIAGAAGSVSGITGDILDYYDGNIGGWDATKSIGLLTVLGLASFFPGLGAIKLAKNAKLLKTSGTLGKIIDKSLRYGPMVGLAFNGDEIMRAFDNLSNGKFSTEDLQLLFSVLQTVVTIPKLRATSNKKLRTTYDMDALALIALEYPDIIKDLDTHYEMPTKNGGRVRVSSEDIDAIQLALGSAAKNEAFHEAQRKAAAAKMPEGMEPDLDNLKVLDLKELGKWRSPFAGKDEKGLFRNPRGKEAADEPILVSKPLEGMIPYYNDKEGQVLFLKPYTAGERLRIDEKWWEPVQLVEYIGDKWDTFLSKLSIKGVKPTKISEGVYEVDGHRYYKNEEGQMLRETPEGKEARILHEKEVAAEKEQLRKIEAEREAKQRAIDTRTNDLKAKLQSNYELQVKELNAKVNDLYSLVEDLKKQLATAESNALGKKSDRDRNKANKKVGDARSKKDHAEAKLKELSISLDKLIKDSNELNGKSLDELEELVKTLGMEAFKQGGSLGFARYVLKALPGAPLPTPEPLETPLPDGYINGVVLANGVTRDRYTHGLKEGLLEAARRISDSKYGFNYYETLNKAQDDFSEIYQGPEASFTSIPGTKNDKVIKYQGNFNKAGWNDIMIWPFFDKGDYYKVVSPNSYKIDRKGRPDPADGSYAEITNHRTILGVEGDWNGKDAELKETIEAFKKLGLDYYLDDSKGKGRGVYKLRPVKDHVIGDKTYHYDETKKTFVDDTGTPVVLQGTTVYTPKDDKFVGPDGKLYVKTKTGTMIPASSAPAQKSDWLNNINWGGVGETVRAGFNIAGAAAATKAVLDRPIHLERYEHGQEIVKGSYQDLKEAELGQESYNLIAERNKTSDATKNMLMNYELANKGLALKTMAASYDANKIYDSMHRNLATNLKYAHLNKLTDDANDSYIVEEAIDRANAKGNLIENVTDTVSNLWATSNKLLMENVARKQQLYSNYLNNKSQNLLASAAALYSRSLQSDPTHATKYKTKYDLNILDIYNQQFKDSERLFNSTYWNYPSPWSALYVAKGSKLTATDHFILLSSKDFNKDIRENNKEFHKDWRENRRNKRKRRQ